MITKVARNDVVRVIRTGEVGLIKGWADHENLAANGTILDVAMGGGRTIQANGNALELVGRAKPVVTRGKRWVWAMIVATALAAGVYKGWDLSHKLDTTESIFFGFTTWFFWYYGLKGWLLYPRRTRVTLPKAKPVGTKTGYPHVSK